MAKFEEIRKANETIRTMNIKGKEYAEVHQRIKAFRMVYPDGFIMTEIVTDENGRCIIKASVGTYDDGEPLILGTGTAYEKENASYINKTSYIENCETSAVGRALGMAGFGIDTSVASAEEVENAIHQQEQEEAKQKPKQTAKQESTPAPKQEERDPDSEPVGEDEKNYIKDLCAEAGLDVMDVCQKLGVSMIVAKDKSGAKTKTFTKAGYIRMKNHLENHLADINDLV